MVRIIVSFFYNMAYPFTAVNTLSASAGIGSPIEAAIPK
jgi:hypothetical protein